MNKTRLVAITIVAGVGCTPGGTPSKRAYIGLFGDNAVAVLDTTTSKVVTTIPVQAPDGLVITPDGKKVYVSSNSGGVVDVIDTASDQVTTMIEVGTQPAGLAITPDGKHVLVAVQGDGQAAVIDTASDAVLGKTPVGKAHNSAISADGAFAFVASQVTTAPAVSVVDLPGGAAGNSFALDASPRALCNLGGELYVTVAGSAAIETIDAASGKKGSAIQTGGSPHDVRPTIDGSLILTVSQTAGDLEVVDPNAATVTTHVATGTMPHWIGLSSDGKLAFVTNEGDNNVAVIDLGAHSVKRTIPVGNAPRKIAVQP